ncbi:cytidine deaminase Ccd1 [Schizosaccharomyces japonicus yFS275]|uniref:Cytidine deaminase n=1 Tax=Schizosaccharomyces japonicus (strain yFS275 / FY16936) TaxID=402676 RepID=B6JYL2_SCHJY|nr:cytidine deaminase Ccd1 [Schizosaccharomyces japonicus yFS275]EEB06630.1 cytidine deaminase Ccd1 [Schizosaccharomyces japonicus yFS275]
MNSKLVNELFKQTKEAVSRAYCPYSNFAVGAALLCDDKKTVIQGANVENASYSVGICAERTAIVKAITSGHNKFMALGVMCHKGRVSPCGICRQMIREFSKTLDIYMFELDGTYTKASIKDLLPDSFGPEDL